MLSAGSKPVVEPPAELGEVLAHAELRVAVGRVDDRRSRPARRSGAARPRPSRPRGARRRGSLSGSRNERASSSLRRSSSIPLGEPGRREPRRADAPVVLVRVDA